MYTVESEGSSADSEFFELAPADDMPVTIHAIYITQSSELGDDQEEQIRLQLFRSQGAYDVGSGTTATPQALDTNDIAASFTSRVALISKATLYGSKEILLSESFNVRTGWCYLPTPKMRPSAEETELLVLDILAVPADPITWAMTVYVEEA